MSESRDNIQITRLVLDVLKPHQPDVVEFSKRLAKVEGIRRVDSAVTEVDAETETVKMIIDGNDLDVEEISEAVRSLGGAIHSIDAAVVEKTERRK
ncbi:MAG: DUF211 domain-containing protein [Nitrososphaerota archaeon]|nr:DUF211 domain-containing protein [Candidatus Calditenuaceae archaeon]MDW8073133.1 DUF211 domain-containing protein [Nitrososphaerota archaeon]